MAKLFKLLKDNSKEPAGRPSRLRASPSTLRVNPRYGIAALLSGKTEIWLGFCLKCLIKSC